MQRKHSSVRVCECDLAERPSTARTLKPTRLRWPQVPPGSRDFLHLLASTITEKMRPRLSRTPLTCKYRLRGTNRGATVGHRGFAPGFVAATLSEFPNLEIPMAIYWVTVRFAEEINRTEVQLAIERTGINESGKIIVNFDALVSIWRPSIFFFFMSVGIGETAMKDDRVIMITGATSGIGRATAKRFASTSAKIICIGRNRMALAEVESEVKSAGGAAVSIPVDITIDHEIDRGFDEAVAATGRLDVLINAAGHISTGTIEDTSLNAWDAMMNVNLRSVFRLMQLAAPHLEKTCGNIVNVSSVTGLRSFPGVLAYCVSKAGLDQLTRCAALELAPKSVRVNAVNPGVVVTEIHKRGGMSEPDYEKFLERSKTTHPLGRVGQP